MSTTINHNKRTPAMMNNATLSEKQWNEISIDEKFSKESLDERDVIGTKEKSTNVDFYRYQSGKPGEESKVYKSVSKRKHWAEILETMEKTPNWHRDLTFCSKLKQKIRASTKGTNFMLCVLKSDAEKLKIQNFDLMAKIELLEKQVAELKFESK